MIRNMLTEMLEHFGLQIERRHTSIRPGVTRVDSHAGVASVFNADAARQKSDSIFFSNGTRRRVVIENNNDSLR